MEAAAGTASARPTGARLRGAETAGRVLGGVTLAVLAASLALDVHTSSNQQLLYLPVAGALALLGVALVAIRLRRGYRSPALTAYVWPSSSLTPIRQ